MSQDSRKIGYGKIGIIDEVNDVFFEAVAPSLSGHPETMKSSRLMLRGFASSRAANPLRGARHTGTFQGISRRARADGL
jgi:hypothetical protein